MKTNNIIEVCGSITKKESLVSVNYNILKNTCVAEANLPYPGYYETVPELANPNSLFLFTTHYYSLEEVLRIAQNIDSCYMEDVSIARASLVFLHHKYSAIRVKYLTDYENIHLLQSCFLKEGVEFVKKVLISDTAVVRVNKCFVLEEIGDGIYIDKKEDRKGYIIIPKQIADRKFLDILMDIKNNADCKLFDAEMGAVIINSQVKEMVRIYSENLNVELLKCIKERFSLINL